MKMMMNLFIHFDNKLKFYTDSTSSFYCGMTYSSVKEHKSFYNFSFEDEKFLFYKLEFKLILVW